MAQEPVWYAVKCIFYYEHLRNEHGQPTFEERIILVQTTSFDEALAIAEEEARAYAEEGSNTCVYTGYANAYELFGQQIAHKTEVYSLMRSSDLSMQEYLDKFYDTGSEHTR